MAERFLHELGATAAAVDRAVTGRDASSGSDAAEDSVARLLDRGDNEFVLANPGTGVPSLRTDARLIFDLVAVFVSGALGAFACARWSLPPTLGYVFAGVLVGPSGLDAVREPVQVSTLAHLGVLFPLFARGAELARDGKREARARSRARGNLGPGTSRGRGGGQRSPAPSPPRPSPPSPRPRPRRAPSRARGRCWAPWCSSRPRT